MDEPSPSRSIAGTTSSGSQGHREYISAPSSAYQTAPASVASGSSHSLPAVPVVQSPVRTPSPSHSATEKSTRFDSAASSPAAMPAINQAGPVSVATTPASQRGWSQSNPFSAVVNAVVDETPPSPSPMPAGKAIETSLVPESPPVSEAKVVAEAYLEPTVLNLADTEKGSPSALVSIGPIETSEYRLGAAKDDSLEVTADMLALADEASVAMEATPALTLTSYNSLGRGITVPYESRSSMAVPPHVQAELPVVEKVNSLVVETTIPDISEEEAATDEPLPGKEMKETPATRSSAPEPPSPLPSHSPPTSRPTARPRLPQILTLDTSTEALNLSSLGLVEGETILEMSPILFEASMSGSLEQLGELPGLNLSTGESFNEGCLREGDNSSGEDLSPGLSFHNAAQSSSLEASPHVQQPEDTPSGVEPKAPAVVSVPAMETEPSVPPPPGPEPRTLVAAHISTASSESAPSNHSAPRSVTPTRPPPSYWSLGLFNSATDRPRATFRSVTPPVPNPRPSAALLAQARDQELPVPTARAPTTLPSPTDSPSSAYFPQNVLTRLTSIRPLKALKQERNDSTGIGTTTPTPRRPAGTAPILPAVDSPTAVHQVPPCPPVPSYFGFRAHRSAKVAATQASVVSVHPGDDDPRRPPAFTFLNHDPADAPLEPPHAPFEREGAILASLDELDPRQGHHYFDDAGPSNSGPRRTWRKLTKRITGTWVGRPAEASYDSLNAHSSIGALSALEERIIRAQPRVAATEPPPAEGAAPRTPTLPAVQLDDVYQMPSTLSTWMVNNSAAAGPNSRPPASLSPLSPGFPEFPTNPHFSAAMSRLSVASERQVKEASLVPPLSARSEQVVFVIDDSPTTDQRQQQRSSARRAGKHSGRRRFMSDAGDLHLRGPALLLLVPEAVYLRRNSEPNGVNRSVVTPPPTVKFAYVGGAGGGSASQRSALSPPPIPTGYLPHPSYLNSLSSGTRRRSLLPSATPLSPAANMLSFANAASMASSQSRRPSHGMFLPSMTERTTESQASKPKRERAKAATVTSAAWAIPHAPSSYGSSPDDSGSIRSTVSAPATGNSAGTGKSRRNRAHYRDRVGFANVPEPIACSPVDESMADSSMVGFFPSYPVPSFAIKNLPVAPTLPRPQPVHQAGKPQGTDIYTEVLSAGHRRPLNPPAGVGNRQSVRLVATPGTQGGRPSSDHMHLEMPTPAAAPNAALGPELESDHDSTGTQTAAVGVHPPQRDGYFASRPKLRDSHRHKQPNSIFSRRRLEWSALADILEKVFPPGVHEPLYKTLFILGFICPPCWWIAAWCIPPPRDEIRITRENLRCRRLRQWNKRMALISAVVIPLLILIILIRFKDYTYTTLYVGPNNADYIPLPDPTPYY
ncbi:hypothetical protein IWQ60_003624 [Tieghemiomyces parasiticus]|uniref:Uncharacterized protein n=1 Tax=Tieghemiomyces parasiticus TaxID=78921 RepID=A0A9W8AH74_9FUNG|nr:hypothetical protein IWQ60_003624 [Tieghemiomyces parasiticus]